MPTYIFKCEGCGVFKPILVQEAELAEFDKERPIQKDCLPCGTMTNWMLAFPDRRSVGDRRTSPKADSQ